MAWAWRLRLLPALLAAMSVTGVAVCAAAESWTETLRIAPITTPIDLRYRPVSDVRITFGRMATEQHAIQVPHPVERSTGTMRIDQAGGKLAVTVAFEPAHSAPLRPWDTATLRLLISPKGELFDLLWADAGGEPFAVEGSPILAELEQSLYLALPRFPDAPVRTGDLLYDYEIDLGPVPGVLPVRVRGTVRGTTTYNGRQAVVVDYRSDGKAEFDIAMSYSEQGYELIDVATGLVVSLAGTETYTAGDEWVRWRYGFEALLP
jgi:hypothetical protein